MTEEFSFNYCSDTATAEERGVQGWPPPDSVRRCMLQRTLGTQSATNVPAQRHRSNIVL